MGKINESQLKQQIKAGEFCNVYFVYGEETYLKEYYIKKMKKKLVDPAFEDFNFHSYEGRDAVMSDILQAADMMPMMSEYSMVLVRDFPFDKQSDVDEIKKFFEDVPQNSVLVFLYDAIAVDMKKQKKWASIEKAFASAGASVNLEKKSEGETARLVAAAAKKRGCTIDMSDAVYLVSVTGNDIKTVLNELEKICAYRKEGAVTKVDIDLLATKSLSARVYDLSKYIVRGDSDNAYRVLNALFAQKEEPIEILAVISSCYIDMYRAKCAKSSGADPMELKDYFPYKGRDFVIKNAARDCRNMSFENLRSSIDVLSDTDSKLKSTPIDKNFLLEEAVAKLLALKGM